MEDNYFFFSVWWIYIFVSVQCKLQQLVSPQWRLWDLLHCQYLLLFYQYVAKILFLSLYVSVCMCLCQESTLQRVTANHLEFKINITSRERKYWTWNVYAKDWINLIVNGKENNTRLKNIWNKMVAFSKDMWKEKETV